MKIKSIKQIPFEGTVYNLGVADDESYVANGIVVHNCRCTLIPITSVEIDNLKAKGEGIKVSTEADLPPDFPDPGFKSFSEKNNDIQVNGDHEDFIRFDPNSPENGEGRWRLRNPKDFEKIWSVDEWKDVKTAGVRYIVGTLKDGGELKVQAIRFGKDWTEDRATSWWDTHKDKFEKTWTQADWDKTKYTVTYNGLTSDPSTYAEAKGCQKAVKMMGGGDVEMVEIII